MNINGKNITCVSIAVFLFHFCDKDEFKHFLYNMVIESEVT